MSAEPMKVCKGCGVSLPIEKFSVRRCEKDGRDPNCKACSAQKQKAWRDANKEHIKATKTKYREANRAHLSARERQRRVKNIDSYRAARRRRYYENREAENAAHKKWCEANRQRLSMYEKARYQADPEKSKTAYKVWCKTNPEAAKTYAKNSRDNLVDGYVKTKLAQRSGLAPADIPPALVELKREQLQIKRMARELKNSIKQLKAEVTP